MSAPALAHACVYVVMLVYAHVFSRDSVCVLQSKFVSKKTKTKKHTHTHKKERVTDRRQTN